MSISLACNGRVALAGGFRWRFAGTRPEETTAAEHDAAPRLEETAEAERDAAPRLEHAMSADVISSALPAMGPTGERVLRSRASVDEISREIRPGFDGETATRLPELPALPRDFGVGLIVGRSAAGKTAWCFALS